MNVTTLDTSYKWNHAFFFFCDWLISFSIMSSRYIQVVASGKWQVARFPFFFFLLQSNLLPMEVAGLGVESELHLWPMLQLMATLDP